MPVGLALLDRDLRYCWINRELAEMNGRPREDHFGRTVAEIVPAVADLVESIAREIFRTGQPRLDVQLDSEVLGRADVLGYWLASFFPIAGSGGEIDFVGGVVKDVTALKTSHLVAQAAEKRLREILQRAPVGLFLSDRAAQYVFVNEECTEIIGVSEEETLGRAWEDRLHPEDRERVLAEWQHSERTGSRFDSEYRFVTPEGRTTWVLGRAVDIRDASGALQGFVGSIIDINERRRAAAEREGLLLRERAARREAEQANRARGEFLAVLSHELRTPLNAIVGWADVLRDDGLSGAEASEALDAIIRNALAQNQLVKDLLDLARIDRGELDLDPQERDVADIVTAAIETVRPAAMARSIHLTSSIGSHRPAMVDAARLQQVVWNLLTNAIKFTPDGGAIDVRITDRGAALEIAVADNGRGISPCALPRVFERFWHQDSSGARSGPGLGLGLAIARHLVELHGGTISASSDGEGRGATFAVALPFPPEPDPGTP